MFLGSAVWSKDKCGSARKGKDGFNIIAIVLHKYLIVLILNTSYEFALRDPCSPT